MEDKREQVRLSKIIWVFDGKTQIVDKKDDGSYWVSMLKGMTDKQIDSLMTLARSWNFAPSITKLTTGVSASYDKYSRAYLLMERNPQHKEISFSVEASASSPLYNLPIVIDNWNATAVKIYLNNKPLEEGKDFKVGYVPGLEKSQVILFIKTKTVPVNIKIIQ